MTSPPATVSGKTDTIAAIATPSGRGGIGIVRLSGPAAFPIAEAITHTSVRIRTAQLTDFHDSAGTVIDQGLQLGFQAPHSFTGENVVELQGHGGPVVMDLLLKSVLAAGARLARPGEFSERAFLNDKIDLSQAEAIADLIDSASEQAARSAVRSLQGQFSDHIRALDQQIVRLRMYVEAAIDFPEEEIDFLSDGKLWTALDDLQEQLARTIGQTQQGTLLKEGITLVLAGRPNAGKSSLMNQLSGRDASIVTEIEGTTRDIVSEYIHLDGLPLRLVDTAGLRHTEDLVEKEGVRRAYEAIKTAEVILLLVDASSSAAEQADQLALPEQFPPTGATVLVVLNKTDLVVHAELDTGTLEQLPVSALTGDGIGALKERIKSLVGYQSQSEGTFMARRRHLQALHKADTALRTGREQLEVTQAGELLAEELRMAHEALCEITGEFSSDDLLGEIFSSFCIGK